MSEHNADYLRGLTGLRQIRYVLARDGGDEWCYEHHTRRWPKGGDVGLMAGYSCASMHETSSSSAPEWDEPSSYYQDLVQPRPHNAL